MKEFEIINKFFKDLTLKDNFDAEEASEVKLSIGDDCAVVSINQDSDLLFTTDTMVAETHFYPDAPAHSIGHKALAVNLSDIAAMGGIPRWVLLSLTLPTHNSLYNNDVWLQGFTAGFASLAAKHKVKLIGGDTTGVINGPLSISITAIGTKSNKLLTRNAAQSNDGIFITGELGEPSEMLELLQNGGDAPLINKLYYPEPRISAGIFIANYANAAIDLSDGFLADLEHILIASNKQAAIFIDKLPSYRNASLAKILTGGDEYELIFTAPMEYKNILENYKECKITNIGIINKVKDQELITLVDNSGNIINNPDLNKLFKNKGWEHFS